MYPSILTNTGQHFDFTKPEEYKYCIKGIAAALSKMNRFCCHTLDFYSVAQHSVIVSYIVETLDALMHDAHEVFIGDAPSPMKAILSDYRALERRVQPVVLGAFGINYPLPPEVHFADLVALATERRDLMPHDPTRWPILDGIAPMTYTIRPLPPKRAEALFLARYYELAGVKP